MGQEDGVEVREGMTDKIINAGVMLDAGQIGCDGQHLFGASGQQVRLEFGEALRGAGDEKQLASLAGELTLDFERDAGSGAADNDPLHADGMRSRGAHGDGHWGSVTRRHNDEDILGSI